MPWTASGTAASTRSDGRDGPTYRTMPAPAVAAATVPSTAAPGNALLPVAMPTTPRVYLWSCGPGIGQRPAYCCTLHRSASVLRPSSSASPMSTTPTSPAARGSSSIDVLSAPNVTVRSAVMPGVGQSTATTCVSRPIARTADAHGAASESSSPCEPLEPREARAPMPRMPSTTRSAAVMVCSERGPSQCSPPHSLCGPCGCSMTSRPASRTAARPSSCALPATSTTSARTPKSRARSRAANSASPPLFPGPTSTTTRSARSLRTSSATTRATAAAARCMSVPLVSSSPLAFSASRTHVTDAVRSRSSPSSRPTYSMSFSIVMPPRPTADAKPPSPQLP